MSVTLALAASTIDVTAPHAEAESGGFEVNPRPHSIAIDWIEAMLLAIERHPPAPTVTTWRMWVVASSMFDAHAAFDPTSIGTMAGWSRRPRPEQTEQNRERAVAYAAHRALTHVFPDERAMFDSVLALHGGEAAVDPRPGSPGAIGVDIADAIVSERELDGSNAAAGFKQVVSDAYPTLYEPVNSADPSEPNSVGGPLLDPNRWTPLRVPTGPGPVDPDDPTTFVDQTFLTPHWGAVEGFALDSGDQFRPPPPPHLGDESTYVDALGVVSTGDAAYRSQAAQVLEYNGALSDEHKVIAEFWADGPHTWTPPGHWVQIAIGVALRDRHTLAEDVALFLAVTGAVLDAGIASWDAKRQYDFVRPATTIPHLYSGTTVTAWRGPGLGTGEIDGAEWRPYQSPTFVTPPFAEYVSGHSTFSRAAAEVLTAFTGSGRMYDGSTHLGRDYDGDGVEDLMGRHIAPVDSLGFDVGPMTPVTLVWPTFRDAADEAGISRLYGGIHFQDADRRGRELGRLVGLWAWSAAELHIDPVRTLTDRIGESIDLGRLDRRTGVRWIGFVERAFDELADGRTMAGCRHLEIVVRAAEVQEFSDDVRLVRKLVCREAS